ncbi:hypothetical protein SAMD00019534_068760 [Acytostelium subglobosum LB1]|uniref:hypothetical protein n=1 Tax=Acytostelium subglobosum LB1 TaxID=1410327 RepID=UPI0006450672|nr:hypothetical protein SAMD00019534_068760 [Acytostelium subglobosum LB1]GAM23701.1 hypothetical protein SAMD00019534_068760 [Acytostelium subglobosum LB1]|eukprot:XP_012753442.1 hypothetical protein SAMD00019534_068760 [Acytostelium subglobosum LB1]
MLNSKDLVTLLTLLSEEDKPLETVSTTFNRTFAKNDHFKIGCAVYTMLKDGFIRVPSHRLIAFYILYSLYNQQHQLIAAQQQQQSSSSSDNTESAQYSTTILEYPIIFNPFLPVFIDELEKHYNHNKQQQQQSSQQQYHTSIYNNSVERAYLIQFLTHLPKDFSKKTSNDIDQQYRNSNNNNESQSALPALNDYRQLYLERLAHHSFPSILSIGVSPTLFFPEQPSSALPPQQQPLDTQTTTTSSSSPTPTSNRQTKNANKQQQQQQQQQQPKLNDVNILPMELDLFSFEPSYSRPAPPLYEHPNLLWINTSINHGLLLSPTMGFSSITNPKKVVRDLMSKAIRGRLRKSQIQQIKAELDLDPKMVLYSGLVPKKLPNLVENNQEVAIEAMLKLIHSPDFKDYFQELISMEMNYRSMEVVNALATSVELPSHFIPMYISNCINTCNYCKDKAMLQRSVRLVCVFIQSLIRNNIINIKDLFEEVQAFCLEHSKIREAIGLFKLMNEENLGNGNNNNSNNNNGDNNNNNNS